MSKKNAETSNYDVPNMPIKIQDGDTGFELVKKHWNKFIMNFDEYFKSKKKKEK